MTDALSIDISLKYSAITWVNLTFRYPIKALEYDGNFDHCCQIKVYLLTHEPYLNGHPRVLLSRILQAEITDKRPRQ